MAKKATENKENYKPVFIPKYGRNDDSQYVAVNGKSYQIKKGETVLVPPEVEEVLRNSEEMREESERYIMANLKEG